MLLAAVGLALLGLGENPIAAQLQPTNLQPQGAILLWDLHRLPGARKIAVRELSPAELDVEWQSLGGEDATRVYRAQRAPREP
jgi:hypothetical protein